MVNTRRTRTLPKERNSLYNDPVEDYTTLITKCRAQVIDFADGPATFVRLKCTSPDTKNPHFLMRMAKNSHISATSMFRSAFPKATPEEEEAEMSWIQQHLHPVEEKQVSGLWVSPEDALALAKDYHMTPFIKALLEASTVPSTYATPSRPSAVVGSHSAHKRHASKTRKRLMEHITAASSASSASGSASGSASVSVEVDEKDGETAPMDTRHHTVVDTDEETEVVVEEKVASKRSRESTDKTESRLRDARVETDDNEKTDRENEEDKTEDNEDDDELVQQTPRRTTKHVSQQDTSVSVSVSQPAASRPTPVVKLPRRTSSITPQTGIPSAAISRPQRSATTGSSRLSVSAAAAVAAATAPATPARSRKRTREEFDEDATTEKNAVKPTLVPVKRARISHLETQIKQERRKVRALTGLVVGLGAGAILPFLF